MKKAAAKATQSRKKYDSDDSKRRLLKAALDIFAKDGYDAATTRAIAKKAGVNEALIQRYFEGKLGLLITLSVEFKSCIGSAFNNDVHDTLEAELTAFFRARIAFIQKNKKFLKVLLTQAILNPEFRNQMSKFSKEASPDLLRNLRILQERGLIRVDADLEGSAKMINTMSAGLNHLTQIIEIAEPDYVEEFIPLIVRTLCDSLRPPTK